MPGPGGGGSRGGGFSGGSFGGGGFSGGGGRGFGGGSFGGNNAGGSFGGSHHHHHHHGPRIRIGGWGYGPFGGGGCSSIVSLVIILAFLGVFALIWFAEPGTVTINGRPVHIYEEVTYDEGKMQDYANSRYKEAFGEYPFYEDNILLVFLSNEAADGYYTIAWVGDNVKREINEMFGEYTEYGSYMSQYINTNYYAYTLDMNLADVVNAMEKSISQAQLGSSFYEDNDHDKAAESKLYNYDTRLDISAEIVDSALESFTDKTGIPCVIVVDTVEKVFGNAGDSAVTVIGDDVAIIGGADGPTQVAVATTSAVPYVFIGIAAVGLIIVAVVLISASKKKRASASRSESKNDMPWES